MFNNNLESGTRTNSQHICWKGILIESILDLDYLTYIILIINIYTTDLTFLQDGILTQPPVPTTTVRMPTTMARKLKTTKRN